MNTNLRKVDDNPIKLPDYTPTLWDKINRYPGLLTNIYRTFRYDIPRFISNLFHWIPTLYDLRYWDYGFMLGMEYRYLSMMLKRYESHDYIEDQWVMIRDIKLLLKLLKLIEYDDDPNRMVNIGNYCRFISNDSWKDHDSYAFKTLVREEKLWKTYCLVRERVLRRLWD